jgi:hypothetical protein
MDLVNGLPVTNDDTYCREIVTLSWQYTVLYWWSFWLRCRQTIELCSLSSNGHLLIYSFSHISYVWHKNNTCLTKRIFDISTQKYNQSWYLLIFLISFLATTLCIRYVCFLVQSLNNSTYIYRYCPYW